RVLAAVAAGDEVYVVEGEKDVETLERAGATATCNPGGAGKWRREFSEVLRGAKVLIVADCDEPGRRHAAEVAETLLGVAASLEVIEPAAGKDAADHIAAGFNLGDFRTRAVSAGEELSRILDELVAYLRRFIVRGDLQAVAIALWLVHTHV